MHPYTLVPLAACIASAAIAVSLWLRAPTNRRIYPVVSLGILGAFWALCEVLWSLAPNPDAALSLQRLSAPAWIGLGPLALHMVQKAIEEPDRRISRIIGALYALAGLFLVLAWTTPWLVERAVPTAWGYGAVPGRLFPIYYVITMAAAGTALYRWIRHLQSTPERIRGWKGWLATIGLMSPMVAASLTDGILPTLGVHPPRIGTLSVTALVALQVMSLLRYGHGLLIPEGFTAKILETIPDGLAAVSLSGHVRALNEAMARFFGVPRAQLVGSCLIDSFSEDLFDPPREVRELECRVIPRIGDPIPVSISTTIYTDKLEAPHGIVLVVRDLREVAALRNRLVVSGRLAAVGELAAGIAHEISNPITYVRTNLSVLREHWSTVSKALAEIESPDGIDDVIGDGEDLIEESLEGVDRAAAIVRDVREFSHAGPHVLEMADVNELLEQTLRVARLQIPKEARIEKRLGALPLIPCQPQRIKQVLMNLILNAAQAIESDGTICLVTEDLGNQVLIRVEDDGCGISAEFIDRIFDPFFTTKPVGIGTGLGLAIAFGIVKQHGGELEVHSTPKEGTSFFAYLPADSDRESTAATS
jgi:two-component system NtrC family sensor kinase